MTDYVLVALFLGPFRTPWGLPKWLLHFNSIFDSPYVPGTQFEDPSSTKSRQIFFQVLETAENSLPCLEETEEVIPTHYSYKVIKSIS